MTLIADFQYFSPYIFFLYLNKFDYCILDQYEHFQKMSFRNRCMLAGGNGVITLSIPVIGGRNQKTIVKDVRILRRENWQASHWKTITSCYNKSPWFDHYRDELAVLYTRKFEFLIDWNFTCLLWISDKLSIKTAYSFTDKYENKYDVKEFEDLRGRFMPSTINKNFTDAVRYPQVFEDRFGFVPNLSILDYLFCNGPRRRESLIGKRS
ncbi:MAG TPA: WbqC family protein [Flavitalea sp.]|nr:WbqC family protein [Flavitalea sp.]